MMTIAIITLCMFVEINLGFGSGRPVNDRQTLALIIVISIQVMCMVSYGGMILYDMIIMMCLLIHG